MIRGLVIFDCDGVLVDSEDLSTRELTSSIRLLGVGVEESTVRAVTVGGTIEGVVEWVQGLLGGPVPPGWVEDFHARRAEVFRRELSAMSGAAEVVTALRRQKDLRVCVASQARLEETRFKLALTGLDRVLGDAPCFSATMVDRPKPAPDLFLHAARTMGAKPSACVVVEDTVTGVRAGVAAGMRVFGFAPAGDGTRLRAAGAEVLSDLRELPRHMVQALEPE